MFDRINSRRLNLNMVPLHLLVLYGLCPFFILMVFLLVLWGLGIGHQRFLIFAEWNILVVKVLYLILFNFGRVNQWFQ